MEDKINIILKDSSDFTYFTIKYLDNGATLKLHKNGATSDTGDVLPVTELIEEFTPNNFVEKSIFLDDHEITICNNYVYMTFGRGKGYLTIYEHHTNSTGGWNKLIVHIRYFYDSDSTCGIISQGGEFINYQYTKDNTTKSARK